MIPARCVLTRTLPLPLPCDAVCIRFFQAERRNWGPAIAHMAKCCRLARMNTREWAYRKLIDYIKAAGLTISLPGEILVW